MSTVTWTTGHTQGQYQHYSAETYIHTPRKQHHWNSNLHHPFPSPPTSHSSPVGFLEAQVEELSDDPWSPTTVTDSTYKRMDSLESSWRVDAIPGASNEARARTNDLWGTTAAAGGSLSRPAGLHEIPPMITPNKKLDPSGAIGPLPVAVWANVMDTSKGRDKVLKCAQYSLRTYIYLLSLLMAVRPLSPWWKSNSKRVKLAISGLSLTRKCLLLLNPLHPLTALLSPNPTSAPTLLRHLIDLSSALADDIYCWSRLGLVSHKLGKKADRWANRFWLLTTLMGLYTLHLRTIPRIKDRRRRGDMEGAEQSSRELVDANWTSRKLLADLVFVSYDVFHLTWFQEPVKCIAGLLAAFISTSKVYDSHWRASLGKG